MKTSSDAPRWWVPGDWNGFFGLFTNVALNVIVLTGLCLGVVKMPDGIASPTRFTLASGEALTHKIDSGGINGATMTLHDVDVVLISK